MFEFTATQWVQIIAALTLPLGLLVVLVSRLASGKPKLLKPLKWWHMMMAILWAVIPTLVILGVRGYLSKWVIAGGIGLVVLASLFNVGSSGD